MKSFDLEAAKRGKPIACVTGSFNDPVNFIGVTSYGEIVVEYTGGTVTVVNPKHIFMAEPPRPEWQQKLIDAAKAGKVVEVDILGENKWSESSFNVNPDGYDFGTIPEDQFRIRPKKVTRYLWAYKPPTSDLWAQINMIMTEEEAKDKLPSGKLQRLDWSAIDFEE